MKLLAHLLLACVLALVSAVIVRVMVRVGTLDHPGTRSSHDRPTPKGGGVGIVAAFLLGMVVLFVTEGRARMPVTPVLGLAAASVGLAAVSYMDDIRSWPFAAKLAAQIGAALLVIACGMRFGTLHLPWLGSWDTGWLGVPLTAGWILFAVNAVNFIDGLNGLASGSVAIACLFLAEVGAMQGDRFVYAAAFALAAGIAGFLPFNFPAARIFMGDVGSQFCGFVVAVLGVRAAGWGDGTPSVLLVPLLLMGVWFDVAFTLVRRAVAGDRLTEAHRSHLYQVANRAGLPAPAVTLVHWGMVAWGGACCLAFAGAPASWRPALLAAVVLPQAVWLARTLARARSAGLRRW